MVTRSSVALTVTYSCEYDEQVILNTLRTGGATISYLFVWALLLWFRAEFKLAKNVKLVSLL